MIIVSICLQINLKPKTHTHNNHLHKTLESKLSTLMDSNGQFPDTCDHGRNWHTMSLWLKLIDFSSWFDWECIFSNLDWISFISKLDIPWFPILLFHSREFIKFPQKEYIKGTQNYVDLIDIDTFSVYDMDNITYQVRYAKECIALYYHFKWPFSYYIPGYSLWAVTRIFVFLNIG